MHSVYTYTVAPALGVALIPAREEKTRDEKSTLDSGIHLCYSLFAAANRVKEQKPSRMLLHYSFVAIFSNRYRYRVKGVTKLCAPRTSTRTMVQKFSIVKYYRVLISFSHFFANFIIEK